VAPEGSDARIAADVADGALKVYRYFTDGSPKVAEWDGRDGGGDLVPSGVYKLVVRVADGVGNTSTRETVVVKDAVVPAITQIGGKPVTGAPLEFDASADGSPLAVKGTATNLLSYGGYRLGVRPQGSGGRSTGTDWIGASDLALSATGWQYLDLPYSVHCASRRHPNLSRAVRERVPMRSSRGWPTRREDAWAR